MKRIILLLLIGCSGSLIFAQDIIIKINSEEIKAKVLEITSETIKYKAYDFQDGPLRSVEISEVNMILYENGKKEVFNEKNPPTIINETPPSKESIRKGTHLGFHFTPGLGKVTTNKSEFDFGYNIGLDFNIFSSDYAGIKIGLSYLHLPVKYEITDFFYETTENVESISLLGIPIQFIFKSGNNVGFYFDIGLSLYHPITSFRELLSSSEDSIRKEFIVLAGETNFGLHVKASDQLSLNIGPLVHYSFSDIFKNEESNGLLLGFQMGMLVKISK
ncbi:hypothetical protein ACFLRZ_02680 [Bacteroidota bacterium]